MRYGRAQTVNEMIIGSPCSMTVDEQNIMNTVLRERLEQNPDIKSMVNEFKFSNTPKRRIKNLGGTGATEMIGRLGIWLSQFSDEQIEGVLEVRRRRRDW